jgi:hypothetical protein
MAAAVFTVGCGSADGVYSPPPRGEACEGAACTPEMPSDPTTTSGAGGSSSSASTSSASTSSVSASSASSSATSGSGGATSSSATTGAGGEPGTSATAGAGGASTSGGASEGTPVATCVLIERGLAGDVEDTYIASDLPASSFGGDPHAFTAGATTAQRQMLIRFDLSKLPEGASVTKAAITLHRSVNGSGIVVAHRVTQGWSEAAVTWASFAGAFDAAEAMSFSTAGGPVTLDATAIAQEWLTAPAQNFGLLFEETAGGGNTFLTSESPQGDLPALSICYVK